VFYFAFLFSGLFYDAVSDPIEHSLQFSGFLSSFINLISVLSQFFLLSASNTFIGLHPATVS
jgi:hypothetical protein